MNDFPPTVSCSTAQFWRREEDAFEHQQKGKFYIYSTKKNTEDTGNLSELLKGVCAQLLLEYTKSSFQLEVEALLCSDMLPRSCSGAE